MIKFHETAEADAFIASATSRETSTEIMQAIAWFARNLEEAESLWCGDGIGKVANLSDIVERVTKNGMYEASDYLWGAAGSKWATSK